MKNKTLIRVHIFIVVSWVLASCTAFDLTNTSQIYRYPKPVIEQLALEDNELKITISLNMNPNNRGDFEKYVIFVTNADSSFSSLTSRNLNDTALLTTSSLPAFIADTGKPNFSGSFVDPLTQTISLSDGNYGFQKNNSYKIIVLAWGENAEYGSSFNNNGWIFSPFSEEATFHYRPEEKGIELYEYSERTNNNNYGFNLQNNQITLVNANVSNNDPLSSTNQLIFYLERNNSTNPIGLLFTSNGSLIQPLGFGSFSKVTTLPTTNYLTAGRSIPINLNNVYAIKNSDNTFMKIYISSLNLNPTDNKITITLDIAYSTMANERNL